MFFLVLTLFIAGGPAETGQTPEFKRALPGWRFEFPGDHRVHREFRTEWWYYNGHLQDARGNFFGYQLTFFRVGLVPRIISPVSSRWRIQEILMAHLALTDISQKSFRYLEKASRANLGLAGADGDRYRVWVENWKIEEDGPTHVLLAGDKDMGLSLKAVSLKSPALHGRQGVSQKGEGRGHASHYYSLTRMQTEGFLGLRGKQIPVTGLSWMDHEFGSNQLQAYQVGWDWFSIQLDNGWELMIYQIRHPNGQVDPYSSGTLIREGSKTIHLPLSQWQLRALGSWKSPKSQATYPAFWKLNLPTYGLTLQLKPFVPDQELLTLKSTKVTYWEGAVSVKGDLQGHPIKGRGYVEMTGYDKRFVPRL